MFNLDTEAAKTSDSIGNRIDTSDIYTGVITRAEWSKGVGESKSEFMNIDFKDDDGKEASYMSICFKKRDGTNSFGYNILNKMMACCSLRSLNKAQIGDKLMCPELTNARIKFALQAEHDWYQDKVTGEWKPTVNMIISIPFKADTGQSAKEVLESAPAVAITTTVVNDRKPKDKPIDSMEAPQKQSFGNAPQLAPAYQQAGQMNEAQQASGGVVGGADEWDDSIPF